MRRVPVLVLAALVIAAVPATAIGAPSEHFSDTQTAVFCEALLAPEGTAFVDVAISDEFGTMGGMAFWAAPADPFAEPPDVVAASADVMFSADRSSVVATFDLVAFDAGEPSGSVIGTGTLEAGLAPVGDPIPLDFEEGGTNRQFRVTGTSQERSVEGTLALDLPSDDVVFELDACAASTDTVTVFATNPAATVTHGDQIGLFCTWEDADTFVSLSATTDDQFAFSDLFVVDSSGEYSGFSDPQLTATSYEGQFELFVASEEPEEPGDPVGSASASATLIPTGERIRFTDRFDNFVFKAMGEELAVAGELTVETPAGTSVLAMDETSCSAQDVRVMSRQNDAAGPKGRPQPNDAPEGAIPLAIGDAVRLVTGGTAFEPEASCMVSFEEESFDIFMTHTVWYTVEGTGGPISLDTAGSDFDTVLGVYTADGSDLAQVACVDDVFVEPDGFSLQASVTIDSVAGVTYYVQAGGLSERGGRLLLSVE